MATSRVAVTEGSGKNLATHSFSEDAVTKEVSRVNLNTSAGVETGVAASPLQVSLANHGANATPVVVDLGANNDVTVTGTVDLGATDNAVLDTIAAKDFATQTTLAAINAKLVTGTVIGDVNLGATDNAVLDTIDAVLDTINAKLVTGTDIGDVTINNSTGAAAVNIQDGGNTITVDGTVAVTNAGITTIAGAVAGTEMQVDVVAALPAGTNAIGKLAANTGVDIGDVDVTSISAGTNLIGDVSLQPRTTNGCDLFRSIDLDESEEEVKATAGNIFGYYFANTNASARYLKLYNATAANVTVGTTTPVATFYLPPVSAGHVGLPFPISFSTAISAAATTGVADADTGAPGANEVLFMAFYK